MNSSCLRPRSSQEETEALIDEGIAAWQDAFSKPPTFFSFPGQWGTRYAVDTLKRRGIRVRTLLDGAINRIYHCETYWCSLACKAWFQDLF